MRSQLDLHQVSRTQNGIVTREQARAGGLSPDQLRRRCRRGDWIEVFPGIYRLADVPDSPQARIRAAGLWAGQGSSGQRAWVSDWAAAYWWGLTDSPPRTIELIIPRSRYLRPQPGVVIRRFDPDVWDVCRRDRLSVTGPAFTALCCAVRHGNRGAHVLDRALQGPVTPAMLAAVIHRNSRARWHGAALRLVTAAMDGAAESERLLVASLRRAGLRGWVLGHRVPLPGLNAVIDLAFREQKVAIEVDGWAWHHTPERFRLDRRRQNALLLAGWTVLRFTWFDLVERPAEVLLEIRAALAQAAAA